MLSYYLTLRPADWSQNLEHYASIDVEGRRLIANCEVEAGSDLVLSNGLKLDASLIQLQVFEAARMRKQLAKMPEHALGSLDFHDAQAAHAEFPAADPFVAGWFVLSAQSVHDAWDQVLHGGYVDCSIQLGIGPVESSARGWRWDVKSTPHLVIETVAVSFTRRARLDTQPENRPFWKR